MDIYSDRQKDLGLNIPQSVMIIGCGGLGYWVSTALTVCGINKMTLIDGDNIESTNLNRTLYTKASIGFKKADVLKNVLLGLRPENDILAIPEMCSIDMLNLFWDKDVIIDMTDDYEFQKKCYKWSKENSARYIRTGCNINHITVTSSVPDWTIEDKKERVQCGVHIAAWVVPCMKAAQYTVDKVVRRPDLEICEEV